MLFNLIITTDHFADVSKMVAIGSNAQRKQDDYELSRYACYLIVQNVDSRKKVVATADKQQYYFKRNSIKYVKKEMDIEVISEITNLSIEEIN